MNNKENKTFSNHTDSKSVDKENKIEKLVKEIVIERIKNMAPNVKIALGSKGKFLSKEGLLSEVIKGSPTGKKIIEIQLRSMRALKKGIV